MVHVHRPQSKNIHRLKNNIYYFINPWSYVLRIEVHFILSELTGPDTITMVQVEMRVIGRF